MTITFISKFGKRPMHLFGSLGTLLFFIGFGIAGFLTVEKFFFQVFKMADRPLFYMSLLSMIIGSVLFVGGFLAELISRNSSIRNSYNIEKTIGVDD